MTLRRIADRSIQKQYAKDSVFCVQYFFPEVGLYSYSASSKAGWTEVVFHFGQSFTSRRAYAMFGFGWLGYATERPYSHVYDFWRIVRKRANVLKVKADAESYEDSDTSDC